MNLLHMRFWTWASARKTNLERDWPGDNLLNDEIIGLRICKPSTAPKFHSLLLLSLHLKAERPLPCAATHAPSPSSSRLQHRYHVARSDAPRASLKFQRDLMIPTPKSRNYSTGKADFFRKKLRPTFVGRSSPSNGLAFGLEFQSTPKKFLATLDVYDLPT